MEKWKGNSAKVLYNCSQIFLTIGVIGVVIGILLLMSDVPILCIPCIITGMSFLLGSFILNGFAELLNETIAIREGIDLLNQSNKPLPNKNSEIKETYNSDLPDL